LWSCQPKVLLSQKIYQFETKCLIASLTLIGTDIFFVKEEPLADNSTSITITSDPSQILDECASIRGKSIKLIQA